MLLIAHRLQVGHQRLRLLTFPAWVSGLVLPRFLVQIKYSFLCSWEMPHLTSNPCFSVLTAVSERTVHITLLYIFVELCVEAAQMKPEKQRRTKPFKCLGQRGALSWHGWHVVVAVMVLEMHVRHFCDTSFIGPAVYLGELLDKLWGFMCPSSGLWWNQYMMGACICDQLYTGWARGACVHELSVLEANVTSMELLILKCQFCWTGHWVQMPDS